MLEGYKIHENIGENVIVSRILRQSKMTKLPNSRLETSRLYTASALERKMERDIFLYSLSMELLFHFAEQFPKLHLGLLM